MVSIWFGYVTNNSKIGQNMNPEYVQNRTKYLKKFSKKLYISQTYFNTLKYLSTFYFIETKIFTFSGTDSTQIAADSTMLLVVVVVECGCVCWCSGDGGVW